MPYDWFSLCNKTVDGVQPKKVIIEYISKLTYLGIEVDKDNF